MAQESNHYGGCLIETPIMGVDGGWIIDDNTSIFLLDTHRRKAYYQVKNGVLFDILSTPSKDSCEVAWDDDSFKEIYLQVGNTKYYLDRYITDGDGVSDGGPLKIAAGALKLTKCIHGDKGEESNIPYCAYYRLLVTRVLYNIIKSKAYTYDDFVKAARRSVPDWMILAGDEHDNTDTIISSEVNEFEKIDLKSLYPMLVNRCATVAAIEAANKYFKSAGLSVDCVTFFMENSEGDDDRK